MLSRLRGSLFGLGRRVSAVGSGFVDTFLRDNKVIPTVLALLALLVFAWIVAGAFFGGPDEEQVSNRAEVAQTQDPAFADPLAPEVENRDADSYAAYQFKDPFRQLVAPAETTAATPPPPSGPPADGGRGGAGGGGDGDAGGGGLDSSDSDGDGLGDQREFDLGLDPANPDSDGDGILDGRDDEARGGASRGGAGRGGAGRDGAGGTGYTGGRNGAEDDPGAGGGGGRTGQNGDDLPESGGELLLR